MSVRRSARSSGVSLRYGLWTLLYLAVLYWLSSIPDQAIRREHWWVLLLSNLAHAPIFSGLAVLILKTLGGREASFSRYGWTFILAAMCAGLDEWHQSFVPGRTVSLGDFSLDLAGSACALLVLRTRQLSLRARCEAD